MSGQGKGCGLLDFPKEAEKELKKIIRTVNVLPYDPYLFEKVKLSIVYENVKKYRIEVPLIKFVGDFYQGDGIDIIFDAKWGEHARTFKFHTSVEQAAAEWLLDMLGDVSISFERIEMEAIGKLDNYRDKYGFFDVYNLEFNITDNNYKNGQLEWWIRKFRKEIKTLKINSPETNGVVVKISEDFDCCPEYLELKGRFIIPLDVLLQINAKKIMFEDYSESSNINEDYIVGILENWLNRVEKPKTITFVANFEGSDIGEKVFEQINAIFVRDNELPGTWFHNIPKKNAKITFCHNGNNFEMKIYDSRE